METGNDIVVKSWLELQEALFKDSWDERISRFRSSYVYRGNWNKDFNLSTSLMRIGSQYDTLEPHLLRNFRKYAHNSASPAGDSIWNWLAVAQHHGLPTRLLDWTYSPYVALHFATADISQYDQDASVTCINYVKTSQHLPEALKKALADEGSNVFTPEMLEPVAPSLKSLQSFQQEDYVIFLEPPSLDQRIVHQYALFSLMSSVKAELNTWLRQHPDLYFRVIIPASLKWEVRDKLDQANITERVLFPGLSGLSQWLKRHYTHS
ncbi:FRG domain-containing protein [Pontibacter sp. E15-1]|uniref:FRG domain-containing protein n=1 Tax=Pontibacter sp. E15-1 TaxID=2919918 RepID=UPI001F4FC097|nr:FRG domain-containing protein [Pontibacter sp. E15-1]MCJ8165095.1 FRG domain-containing protein [Pontibacter sp. E15-1]